MFGSVVLLVALALGVVPAAAQDTFVDITGLVSAVCTPGGEVVVTLDWATAPGDVSTHHWTLRNLRTGYEETRIITDNTDSGEGIMFLSVPAGTQPGDELLMEVHSTSMLGASSSDSILITCPGSPDGTDTTFLDLLDLQNFSCTPGDWIEVRFEYVITAGDISDHYWALRNQRTGAEESDAVLGLGPLNEITTTGLPVPAGTQPGDVLILVARATSMLGPGSVDSIEFYCDTGELFDPPAPPSPPEPPAPVEPSAPAVFAGKPVPRGFVQTTLVCSTAVFDRPGGEPVGKNAVHAGQSWFLNPSPVEGPDGARWTEVFVAGPHTVYIPTACVGAPTGF